MDGTGRTKSKGDAPGRPTEEHSRDEIARIGAKLADAYCTFDRRTLALTRLLLGFLLLTDLLRRAPHWFDFYTDDGLFPTWVETKRWQVWSLLDAFSTRGAMSVVFALCL